MRFWQRMSTALLALVFAFSLFAIVGCGGKPEKKAESASLKAEQVTLELSYPPFGYSADAEKTFWNKHIAAFEKKNPDIKINTTGNPGIMCSRRPKLRSNRAEYPIFHITARLG